MRLLREWVAGIAAVVSLSLAGDGFRASGIVERIEGNRVLLHIKADDCVGHHEFYLRDPAVAERLRKGMKVFFKATGNPCTDEDVRLLEVRSGVYEEAEDVEVGD